MLRFILRNDFLLKSVQKKGKMSGLKRSMIPGHYRLIFCENSNCNGVWDGSFLQDKEMLRNECVSSILAS